MTPEARQSLAEQLLSNPLFAVLMDELEQGAVEQMVYAETDTLRAEGAMRVRAVRSLRSDCEKSLRSTRERKAAPA